MLISFFFKKKMALTSALPMKVRKLIPTPIQESTEMGLLMVQKLFFLHLKIKIIYYDTSKFKTFINQVK